MNSNYLRNKHPNLNQVQGCHGFVEANPEWSRRMGYLIKGDGNPYPSYVEKLNGNNN